MKTEQPKLGFSDPTGCVYIIIGKEKYDVTKDFELIAKGKEILKPFINKI